MILGIIGGMGPAATVYFMDMLTRMTDAVCDQEHLEMLIHSIPSTPDRTEYILGKSESDPLPHMIKAGCGLVAQGVDVIAIPCMTAHAFHNDIQSNIKVPVLNGITLTAMALKNAGIKKAGVMATDGTVKTRLFPTELTSQGIESVYLSDEGQKKVMSLIYDDVKTGRPADTVKFEQIKDEFTDKGAECIILGCTELSVIKREANIGNGFADAMEILAWHSITECGKTPRVEYSQLVSKL